MGPWELLNVVQKMYSRKGEEVLPEIRERGLDLWGSGFMGVLDLWGFRVVLISASGEIS